MVNDRTRPGWGLAGFSLAVLLLLILGLYRETTLYIGGLWAQWQDGGYGHGYLVLIISLYIVYRKRKTLARLPPCPGIPALFAVAIFTLSWLVATLVDVQVVQYAVLLPLVLSVIWALAGGRVARQLLFPVLFVGFAIPVWSPLGPALQAITADGAFLLARATGVPALLQDYHVMLPAAQLRIVEACSGLHYLLAALTLGVFYAYLNYHWFWQRVLVVIIAAVTAILANILRVFIVIYIAYTSGVQHPLVEDHLSLGWYLFAGLVLALLLVDITLHQAGSGPDADVAPASLMAGPGVCSHGLFTWSLTCIASIALVALGPAMAWWIEQPSDSGRDVVLNFPEGHAGWSGPLSTRDNWMPVYRGAIAEKRAYHSGVRHVYLYLGYYPSQSQGSELINDLNRVVDGKAWYSRSRPVPVNLRGAGTVLEQVLDSPAGQQRLVWYWYQVAGQRTANAYKAKLLQLRGLLMGNTQAAVVAVATDMDHGVAAARTVLNDFIQVMKQPLAQIR